MNPKECKRLAEVDFPNAVVSRHSAREKSIRHGHPSMLYLVATPVLGDTETGSLSHLDLLFCHLDRSGEISRRQARFFQ